MRSDSSGVIVTGLSDLLKLGAISPHQLTEARIWLIDLVVRGACERTTPRYLEALEANVAAAAMAHALVSFEERQMLHREIDIFLARATRKAFIAVTMKGVMSCSGNSSKRSGRAKTPMLCPRANAS